MSVSLPVSVSVSVSMSVSMSVSVSVCVLEYEQFRASCDSTLPAGVCWCVVCGWVCVCVCVCMFFVCNVQESPQHVL